MTDLIHLTVLSPFVQVTSKLTGSRQHESVSSRRSFLTSSLPRSPRRPPHLPYIRQSYIAPQFFLDTELILICFRRNCKLLTGVCSNTADFFSIFFTAALLNGRRLSSEVAKAILTFASSPVDLIQCTSIHFSSRERRNPVLLFFHFGRNSTPLIFVKHRLLFFGTRFDRFE